MATIQERLQRMRAGESPAASTPAATKSGKTATVYDRLTQMRKDSEEAKRLAEQLGARQKEAEGQALKTWMSEEIKKDITASMRKGRVPIAEGLGEKIREAAIASAAEKERENALSWGNIFSKIGGTADTTLPSSGFHAMEQGEKETKNARAYQDYQQEKAEAAYLERLQAAYGDPAFNEKSAPVQLAEADETYAYINDIDKARAKENLRMSMGGATSPYRRYDAMTEEEIQLYNYLYATEGKEAAEWYLNDMADTFTLRLAEDTAPEGTAAQILSGLPAGLQQFTTGISQLFHSEPVPMELGEAYGQVNREKLAGKGPSILGNSLGQTAYDAVQSGANMLVPALIGTGLGPNVSTALFGTSAAGNAYREKLQEGWTQGQAMTYGAVNGILEGYLQKLLGGISGLGGTGQKIAQKVSGIQNAAARAALQFGGSMASEGLEEGLQEALGPVVEAIITRDDLEPTEAEDIMYSALLGALTAGLIEAPGVVMSGRRQTPTQAQTQRQERAPAESDGGLVLTMPEELAEPGDWQSVQARQRNVENQVRAQDQTDLQAGAEIPTAAQEQNTGGFVNMSRREIAESDAVYLDTLARAAGVPVRMVNREGTAQQGWYDEGQIFIRADAADPAREIVKHEITHLMQQRAPAEYQAYRNFVREIYQERGTLESAVAELRELYRSNHVELTEEQALDELAADFAGELTENETLIRELAGEKPSLGRRIWETIRELAKKLRSALGWQGRDPETQRLERAARLWESALEGTALPADRPTADTGQAQTGPSAQQGDDSGGLVLDMPEELRQDTDWIVQQERSRAASEALRQGGEHGMMEAADTESGGFESRGSLTEEESGALLDYKSSGSYKINAALRDGGPLAPEVARSVENLDRALEKLPAYQGPAYRRLIFDSVGGQAAMDAFLQEHRAGEMISYPAYTSTSTSPDGYPVEGEQTLTVMIEGRNGRNIAGFGNNFESEIVFPRNSRFLIEHVETDAQGKPVIYMREVTKDGAGQLYSEKRSQTVQQVQEEKPDEAIHMRSVSGLDSGRDADGGLPGLRADGTAEDGLSTETNTRYSMEGSRDLLRQIEILRRQNQRLRDEMKRTDAPRMNRAAVERQAGEVLKTYQSRYDKAALADRMETLYEGIAEQTLSETDMRREAREIAESVIGESQAQVNPLYEEYADLRRELRETKLYLTEQYRGDLERMGGYEAVRRSNMGRLRLSNEGTPVDVFYDALTERHPELFPEDIYHPADQLERIVDVAGELQKVMGNPYEGTKAAEYLANDILERYYETPERRPTFADRQYTKRQRDRAELKGKYEGKARDARERAKLQEQMYYSRILHEREQRQAQQIRDMRQRYRDANRAMSERRTEAQLRDTIARHANRLAGRLLRPNDKQHIPEHLRGSVLNLLRSIDIGSNYSRNMASGKFIRLDNLAEFQQMGLPTKRTQAALQLKESYAKLESDESATLVIDPDLQDNLTEVAQLGETRLADMNRRQLTTLWNAVKAVEKSIQTADKMLSESRYKTISGAANALQEVNWEKHRKPRLIGVAQLENLLSLDMLTPETFFHKLGKPGEALYQQLRQAKDRETTILSDMVEKSQKIFQESGLNPYKLEKEVKEFTLSQKGRDGKPEKITMTTAQIMELYNLSKRKQAIDHLYKGGIRPDAVRKGAREIWKSQAAHITPEDMGKILGTLTPEQKALADKLRRELSTTAAGYGNEASMAAYGYEKFKEKDYWPIKVDRASTKDDVAKEAKSKTIPGRGMTKSTVPKASNPVGIHSVFDTYSQHISEMATYAAWLTASQDIQRVHNFQFENGSGTVKNIFDQVYGPGGNRYFKKLMEDIAAGTRAVNDTEFSMDALTRNFKTSAVGWNVRVVLQQPTAILRAAELIDMKYLAAGMARRGGWEKALRYAPIAKWKDWGYFEIGTGKSLKELMLGPGSRMEKLRGQSMNLAGKMDSVAWGALWNAVELETRDTRPELRRGSQAYYEACAKRFGEIIDRTQVVDSVLHRTQAMRSQNQLYKMATSFMSEPSKVYNQVARNLYDLTSAKTKPERIAAVKNLAGTALALTLSFAANAVAQSVPDTWRDDDDEKDAAEKFSENWVDNFLQNYNPIGYVPFLKDIVSIWEGYDVSRMDMETIASLVEAAKQLQKAEAGESKKTKGYAQLEMVLELCRAMGLPVANIKRDVLGIVNTAFNELGLYQEAYELDKLMYSIENEANRGQFVGDLYRAMDADWEDYETIYQDLVAEGIKPDKIKTTMENQMKKAMGVESVKSLPFRYSAPGEDAEFDSFMQEAAESGEDWTSLLPDGTQEMADLLEANKDAKKLERYDAIATSPWGEDIKETAMENQMGDSDFKRYMAARKAKVSTLQYVDFLQDAYQHARRRTSKSDASPSQADVEAALDKSGLTDAQKRAIWNSYGWKRASPW